MLPTVVLIILAGRRSPAHILVPVFEHSNIVKMSDSSSSSSPDEIPYHLMPVAAICAMYATAATIRALYQIYRNVTRDPSKVTAEMKLRGQLPKPLKSRQFALLVVTIVASVLAYGYVTAVVDNSIAASDIFDRKYYTVVQ